MNIIHLNSILIKPIPYTMTKNIKSTFFYISIITFLFASCSELKHRHGDGDITFKTYEIGDFNEIELQGHYDVEIVPGKNHGVEIETDNNLLDYIEVYTRGNRLIISNNEPIQSDYGIKVKIDCISLERISCGGASKISSLGQIESDRLELSLSGAGKIDLEVLCNELEMNISGAGLIKLSGKTRSEYLELSGAGHLDAFELVSEECNLNLSGVGKANVFVTERLNASVSGIGGVSYRGNPDNVIENVSGLGKIKRDNERNKEEEI